jgi:O-antigen ligase
MKSMQWLSSHTPFYLVAAFLFFLPIGEAPKNLMIFLIIGYALYSIAVPFNEIWEKLGRIKPYDWILLFILFSALLSTLVNWPLGNGLKGFRDVLTYTVIGIFVYHAKFSKNQLLLLLLVLLGSVNLGLVYGYWELYSGAAERLALDSVGSVTTSAIFLAMSTSILLGMLISGVIRKTFNEIILIISFVFFIVSLFVMGSRGSIVGFLSAILLLLPVLLFLRSRRGGYIIGLIVIALTLSVSLVSLDIGKSRVMNKLEMAVEQAGSGEFGKNDGKRFEFWRLAIHQILQAKHHLVGIGPREFNAIDVVALEYTPKYYPEFNENTRLTHAHNMFLNKWVEEGLLGVLGLVSLFVLVAKYLWSDLIRHNIQKAGFLWFAVLGSTVSIITAGSFNTPFINENAVLFIVLVSMYLSIDREGEVCGR